MSTDFYLDANGNSIERFNEVEVPEPNDGDMHNHSFTGIVDDLKNGYVIIADMDCNIYTMEPERLEVLN